MKLIVFAAVLLVCFAATMATLQLMPAPWCVCGTALKLRLCPQAIELMKQKFANTLDLFKSCPCNQPQVPSWASAGSGCGCGCGF